MISAAARLLAALCLLTSVPALAEASSRKQAYTISVRHLVKAQLCGIAEGRKAPFERAIRISKERLVRSGYTRAQANEEIGRLVKKMSIDPPSFMPYVRKICVGEIRDLERQ